LLVAALAVGDERDDEKDGREGRELALPAGEVVDAVLGPVGDPHAPEQREGVLQIRAAIQSPAPSSNIGSDSPALCGSVSCSPSPFCHRESARTASLARSSKLSGSPPACCFT
jgi:hypothetical protein